MSSKFLNNKEIKKIQLEQSWLHLSDQDILDIPVSPLESVNSEFIENPHIFLLRLMKRPENFYFTCKHIFNIEMLPMHLEVMKNLYSHKYPMLIASRGWGKCIRGDSLVLHNNGICTIKELVGPANPGDKNYFSNVKSQNESAGFNDIEYGWNNGLTPTKKIRSSNGFELEGTLDHPIRIVRDGEIKWVELKDVKNGDYSIIDRSEIWFENTKHIDDDLAYLFGLIVGDGGYTVKSRISFTSADNELHEKVNELFLKYFNKGTSQSTYKYDRIHYSTESVSRLFNEFGFNSSECGKKEFPKCILEAPKSAVSSFIRGLMDTDGHCRSDVKGIEYCSKSKELVRMLQFVLTKFGIISKFKERINKKYNTVYYYLYIFGQEVNKFHEKIGFGLNRKQDMLEKQVAIKSNTNKDVLPTELIYETLKENKLLHLITNRKNISFDLAKTIPCLNKFTESSYYYDKIVLVEDSECITYDIHCKGEDHSFNSNGFISHNTFYLALYSMIKAFFQQGSKIVIVGAGFRQAKYVFSYCETIWNNAPILRSLLGNDSKNGPKKDTDRWEIRLGKSTITALPLGHDGSKIRGERATCIIADEMASVPFEVYQTVVSGFAAVRANPIQNVKHIARIQMLKDLGQWTKEDELLERAKNIGNQAIIAGTAYYQNNHFYREWQKYKAIILSKGDKNKLANLGVDDTEDFDWKQYSIIRIPFELIPKGFMDEAHVNRSKITMDIGIYNMEYGACFNVDSTGFFKRSLIDSCTSPVKLIDETVYFSPTLHGSPDLKYVFAIDAASENDNFSIVVLEIRPTHRRVVYCWTTTKTSFRDRMEKGLTDGETSFYDYCARKIRNLAKVFPTEVIAYDTQGGGYSVEEALHDKDKIQKGEDLWWPVIDDNNPKPSDDYPGLHILYPINFASAEWVVEANHGLKKDMADKKLIFPVVDSISYVLAQEEDQETSREYDTLEDCVWEIEEMKNELTTIIHTRTENGRDKWSTPETKTASGKKGKLKKDRYSSLLMANMVARQFIVSVNYEREASVPGGFANELYNKKHEGKLYYGPAWFTAPDYSQFNTR